MSGPVCRDCLHGAEDGPAERCDGTSFRLVGIGASDLCDGADADRGDLADTAAPRDARREAAIDRLRERFGPNAVRRGLSLREPQR